MAAHTYTPKKKSLPLWVVGSQDKTPMCYSVKPLFMVLFLQVCKILVWPTLLLCVWKSHIWSLLVCHEWLWGIRAYAVAWDPSYNNTRLLQGSHHDSQDHCSGPACCICLEHQTRYRGPEPCLLTDLSGLMPRAVLRQKSLLWHHRASEPARGRKVDLPGEKPPQIKAAAHVRLWTEKGVRLKVYCGVLRKRFTPEEKDLFRLICKKKKKNQINKLSLFSWVMFSDEQTDLKGQHSFILFYFVDRWRTLPASNSVLVTSLRTDGLFSYRKKIIFLCLHHYLINTLNPKFRGLWIEFLLDNDVVPL